MPTPADGASPAAGESAYPTTTPLGRRWGRWGDSGGSRGEQAVGHPEGRRPWSARHQRARDQPDLGLRRVRSGRDSQAEAQRARPDAAVPSDGAARRCLPVPCGLRAQIRRCWAGAAQPGQERLAHPNPAGRGAVAEA
jgi:hypothetical protein